MDLPLVFLALLLVSAAVAYYFVVNGGNRYLTLPNVVFLYLSLYPLGMLSVIQSTGLWDFDWILMNLLGPLFLFIGAFVANAVTGYAPRREWKRWQASPIQMDFGGLAYWGVLTCVGAVSVLVMVLYIGRSGHIVFSAMTSVFSGGNLQEIATELAYGRKLITAGVEGYQAPGYLKQFRDVLLPCAVLLVYGRRRLSPSRANQVLLPVLFVATLVFMLSSGQRSPIFLFLFAFSLVAWNLSGAGRKFERRRLPLGLVVLMGTIFVSLTLLLGRVETGGSGLGSIGLGFESLYSRLVVTLPTENLLSKPIWENFGPLWGRGWWDGMMQILPGKQESIYNDLHAYLGGSEEGNSALNLWAEIWINFGIVGVPIIGLGYGYLLQVLHIRYVRKPRRMRAIIYYSFMTSIMPLIPHPVMFVIAGGFTISLLYALFGIADQMGMKPRSRFDEPTPVSRVRGARI